MLKTITEIQAELDQAAGEAHTPWDIKAAIDQAVIDLNELLEWRASSRASMRENSRVWQMNQDAMSRIVGIISELDCIGIPEPTDFEDQANDSASDAEKENVKVLAIELATASLLAEVSEVDWS